MADDRREWQEKFDRFSGAKGFLILYAILFFWAMIGAIISVLLAAPILLLIFFIIGTALSIISFRWKPAWTIYRKMIGNENLPVEPRPHSPIKFNFNFKKIPWYFYVRWIWAWGMVAILVYLAIKYFSKYGF
jgi:hypothetical protein